MKTKLYLSIILTGIIISSCTSPPTPANTSTPTITPTATFTPTPIPTHTSTYTPEPTSIPTSTPIPCIITTGSTYIISGGPNPDGNIFVDDILRVFVNTRLVVDVNQGGRCCQPVPPISFVANTGDSLRVQAEDANACYSLEALWLQKADGSCLTLLTEDIFGDNCDSEIPYQLFFDQMYILD